MRPVLFTLPGLDWPVQAYGFFFGVALIVGWVLSLELAKRDRLPVQPLGTNYVVSVVVGLFVARGIWLLQHPASFEGWRSLVTLRAGELAGMAGMIVAVLTAGTLATLRKIPAVAWYDAAAPALALGLALERVGALLAGSAYGVYAPGIPWAVRYPVGSPVHAAHRQLLGHLLPASAEHSLPVHPTQLYAALFAAVAFVALLWLRERRRFSGQLVVGFAIYWIAVRSFIEEPLRDDAPVAVMGPFNLGQLSALLVLVVLIAAYFGFRASGRQLWKGGRWSPEHEEVERRSKS